MGLSFLAPLFALALVALAVPVIVHLVHRERKDTTPFPSLMFLRRVPYRHSRRRRIRDWLLFALRALAFALLVLAFTRPFLNRASATPTAANGGRDVVLLLDRSFSMRYGDRWAKAVAEARRVVAGLGPRDRLTIVPFDLTAHAVNDATGDRALLAAAIDSLRPSDAGTRYAPALGVARRALAASRLPKRELVVVSDFQRSGFDLTDESRLPAGVTVTPVDVVKGDIIDRAVRTVELRRIVANGREMLTATARVGNIGPVARGVAASLIVAGRVLESKQIDLPKDGGAMVAFAPVPVPDTPQSAQVQLAPDAFPGDDAYNFVFERTPLVNVLLVDAAGAPPERDLFVVRALEIGDKPPFQVTVKRDNQVVPNDITGRDLVILNDSWPAAAVSRLSERVRTGMGVIIATGERSAARSGAVADELLPAPIATPTDRVGERGGVLGYVDAAHPALSLFGASRSGDLSAARFYRYRPANAEGGVLARFDDGSGALVERRVGRGRVLQFASSLDGYWNDLPRQPVFLPFVQQLARYAADYRERRNAYSVGDAVDAATGGLASDSAPGAAAGAGPRRAPVPSVAEAPSGARVRFGGVDEPSSLVPRESGVYAIRRAGAPGERPRLVAVNVDPRELEFARFDPTRLVATVVPVPGGATPAEQSVQQTATDREREQSLWWYLLAGVPVALVAEAILARRLSLGRPTAA